MSITSHETEFSINTKGETTGDQFIGKFKVKTRLTHRDRLLQDQMRRQLLGPQPEGVNPSPRADSTAEILSQIQIRITSAPSWFTTAGNGLELADDNILVEIHAAVMKAESDAIASLQKEAEAAKQELAKTPV